MADNTSVLGQEPILPENVSAPVVESTNSTNYTNLDLKSRLSAIKNMDSGLPSARSVDLPVSSQKLQKRLGEFTPVEGVDIAENIAQDQSGWEQMGYLIPRAAAKAVTEALKLPGFIVGATEWLSTGFAPEEYGNSFNNAWTTSLDNMNTSLQENGLPVYTPKSVQDGDIFNKLASTSFWASEGADGVGFLVGMMVPGAIMRWAKIGERLVGGTKVFTQAEKLAMPGNELAAIAKSAKTAAKINDWSAAVVNTVYESATEGVQTFNDYLLDNPGDIEGAGRAASKTFLVNNAILIGPNILNQRWLFNGFKRAEGALASEAVGKSGVAKILEKSLTTSGKLGALKAPSFLEKTYDVAKKIGKGFVTEGLWEEGMQYAASEGAKKGIDVRNPIELLQEYVKDITADTKGNTEMWSGIVLGGIMGGGMSAFGGIRQAGRETKLASEYHKLLSNGQLNYYKTYKDFAKTENGKPVLLPNGEYDLDPQKVIEGGIKTLQSAALKEQAEVAFKKGDKELYDFLSNIMHFDYMMPWLQIEGGLELLKKHLKFIASTEDEKDIETLGVNPKNIDELHKTLVNKAEKFQSILNKVNDTHDLSFNVKLPEGATKDDLAAFSNNVKNSKLSLKANMDYSAERIQAIKSELANSGIVSTSGRLDEGLVKELKDSYAELKKNKTIDKADAVQIDKNIHSIERLVGLHSESAIGLNDSYDNNKLQTAFNEKIKSKLEAEKRKKDTSPEVTTEKKARQGFIKDPQLIALHDSQVKIEKWDNINNNIKIWDEESQSTISIPGRARLVTTRGIVKITYKDANNKEHTLLAAIGDGNTAGGLDLRIVEEQKDGTFKPDTKRTGLAFLNNANELAMRLDPNSTKFSRFTNIVIDPYKSADDIQMDRQIKAVTQYYKDRIDSIKNSEIDKESITKLSNELKTAKQDLKDEMKEHSKDLMLAKKLEDGTIILGKRETKRVLKIYKNISEMQKIVNEKSDALSKIKEHNRNAKSSIAQFRKDITGVKTSETLPVDDIRKIMEDNEAMIVAEDDMISNLTQQIDNTKRLINNSLIKMRIYRSQVSKILNIDISDTALGAFGMDANEKNELIDRMLLDKINEIWDESLMDTFISEARTITIKLINLRDQVSVLQDMVREMETSLVDNELLRDKYKADFGIYKYRYQQIFTLYKKLVPQYFKEKDIYNESLVNGKLIEGDNIIDPENDYSETFKLGYWEIDPRHPFTGFDSFLTITSNQDHAATNDDIARWFVYVNNFAYKNVEAREHPKHALKTFTYKQIADVKDKFLKSDVKFYLGNGVYMSYDEIQNIKDVNEKKLAEIAASDDIKTIVVDFKDTNKIVLFTKEGTPEDKDNKGIVPIYSSLGLATRAYKESGYDRFSEKKWMEKWAQAKLKEDPSLSKDELTQLASDAYDAEFEKTKSEFEALRNTLGITQEVLNITGINRGVKIDSDLESDLQDVSLSEPNWGKMEFIVSSPIVNKETGDRGTITKEINGNEYKLTAGFTYWLNGTDLEVVKPKTLGETNSVESIFKIFEAIANNKENSVSAVTYLEQALHMLYSTKSDTSKPHRLYFYKLRDKNDKIIEDKYASIVFGESEISMEDIKNGKGVEAFKEFLTNKYWNFDKDLINGTSDFSEYFVNKKGEIKERPWVVSETKDTKGVAEEDKQVGGYQAFLFRGSDTNVTKGTVNLAPVVKQKGDDKYKLAVLNPQYKNKSLRTTLRSQKKEKVEKTKKEKAPKGVQVFDFILHTTKGDKTGKLEFNTEKKAARVTGIKDITTDVVKAVKELIIKGKKELTKFKIEGTDFSVTLNPIKVEEEIETLSTPKEKTKGDNAIEDALKGKKKATTTTVTDADKAWGKASEDTKKQALSKAGNDLTKAKQEYLDGINAILNNKDDMSRPARPNLIPDVDYEVEKKNTREWLTKKYSFISVDVVNGLVDGNLWGKFVNGSKVILSDIAEEGTAYHEGFHIWNHLLNDPDSRKVLYDEVRSRTGMEMTDAQAEEYLAEELRDFMLLGDTYKFEKGEEKKKEFFQKIIDFFKKLLGMDITRASKYEIERAFKTIRDNSFDAPKYTTEKTFEKRIPGIDASRKLAYLKDINYRFFTVLTKDFESGGDILFNLDQNTKDVYDKVFTSYDTERVAFEMADKTPPSYVNEILSNKELFIHNHLLYLTKYNIDLTHTFLLEDISEEDFGRNKAEWIESNKTSMKDDMPSPIRLLIASLRTVDETNTPIRSDYFTRSNIEYDKIVNLLHNNLSNIPTPEGIMDKLLELSESNYPLRNLYRMLGGDIASDKMTLTQFKLYEQFITSFSSNKANVILHTNNNDGSTTQSNLVTDARKEVIKAQWVDKAKAITITKQSKYIKLVNGEYVIDKNKLINALRSNIKDFSILSELGIDISDSLRNSDEVKNYLSTLKNAIEAYPEEVNINALYDRDKIRNQTELDKMSARQALLTQNDEDLIYYNAEGNMEWGINRNSHLTDVKNRLNAHADKVNYARKVDDKEPIITDENLDKIRPYDSSDGTGNLFTNNSLYWDHISNGGKIEVFNLKGMRSQLGTGYDIDDLTSQDYHMLTFDLILNNIIPYRRAADRGVENAFYAMPTNYNMGAKTFIDTMSRYLYDEVVTSVALLVEEKYNEGKKNKSRQFGSGLRNYSKNARSLRTFDFIYNKMFNEGSSIESIESFIKKSDIGDVNIEKIRNISDKYIKKYESVIYKSFSNFINETIRINKENLSYSRVISKEKGRWSIPGINPITIDNFRLSKNIDNAGLLSDEAMNKLLLVHAYNFFVGIQEQHKLFIGDIAFYDNMKSSNKRTKSSNSTREKTPNDSKTIELLNQYYPKITGMPHTNIINEVTLNTIKDSAEPDIVALYDEYRDMDVADGAQFGTLDFIRGFQGRRGLWNDNLERTYQYEMQTLIKRILDSPELSSLAPWATRDMISEDGIPRFKGEIIDPYDIKTMGQIPPIKTQGSGYMVNEINVGASVIDKMAVEPIMPSELNDTKLKTLLTMMSKNIDSISDITTKKGDTYVNDGSINDGYQIDNNTLVTQVSYDDYGTQLDIQDKEKKKVTDSTQKLCTYTNNMFDKGNLLDEYKDLESDINERDELLNESYERAVGASYRELGLKKDPTKAFYTIKDKDVFRAKLYQLFIQKQLPDNIVDGLDEVLDSDTKFMELFSDGNKVEQVLLAFIRNNAIKRKVNGEMFVQVPNTMYSDELKFYSKSEDGKTINMAEVMVPVPEEWNIWVKKIGGIEELNRRLRDGELEEKLGQFLANRIPTADINTIEAFQIKKFIPTYFGARIVLPKAIVAKTSSDFDVDKLTSYLNNFKMTKDGPKYINQSTKESDLEDRYISYVKELIPSNVLDKLVKVEDDGTILLKTYQSIAKDNDIITIEEFGKLSSYKQQSNKSIENRINEIHTRVLLHPARFNYLIRPHSSGRLKEISNRVEKPLTYMDAIERSYGDEYWMATQWWYNNMKADSFWGGKKVLGNTAANNTVNALKQRFPIEVTGPLQNGAIFFKGQKPENNENYIGGHRTDGKNDIADNHGQILVASVDVAKDDFIGKLNINSDTLGVLLYLNTHGLSNGVELETIIKFLTHPVINEYLHELSLSRSQFLQHNQYTFKDRNWFFNKIGSRTDIVKRVLNISSSEYSKMMYAKNKNYIDTKNKYKYLTNKDLEKNDKQTRIQILDNFLNYQDTAWKVASLHSALRPYASNKFGKTLHGIENTIDKFADAMSEDGIFNEKDTARYVDESFLKGAQGVYNDTLDMYGWMSLTTKYPVLNGLLKEHVFNNFITRNQKEYEDATKVAKNQLLSFIFTFYRDQSELRDKYDSLIKGKNSIPVRLRDIKKKLSDKGLSNEALDALIPAVKEFSYDVGRQRENDYLYPLDKKMDVSDQNTFTTALEELLNFKDSDAKFTEEVQQFARDFFEFSIYQNGVGNSPISYTKMLPNDRFVPLMDGVIKYFIDNHSGDMDKVIKSFSHQFFRNNLNDKDVVFRFNKPLPYSEDIPGSMYDKYGVIGDGMVHKNSNAAKHEYIAVRYYKVKKNVRQEDRRRGRKSSMEYMLYRRTINITKSGYVKYELVDKLGDGFRFREYYPTYNGEDVESVLTTNKYEGLAKPKVVTKKEVRESKPKTDNSIADALYQLESEGIAPNEDLDNKMTDFLNAIGVTVKVTDMIKDKFDTEIPAVAVAKFAEMTVEVAEGKRDIKTLPEETSHFYVKLLDENGGLYKSMFNNIVNYSIYNEVSKKYNDRYNGDEKLIREEAIGKLIADRIVNGIDTSLSDRQKEQVNNWWTKLWNTIKELFGKTKTDPYTKVAYDILTKDVSQLTNNIKKENVEMYQLESSMEDQWNELPFTSKGIYKYDYQRTTDAAERAYDGYVNQFGDENVTLIPVTDNTFKAKIAIKRPRTINNIEEVIVQKEDNGMENIKELSKAPIPLKAEQLAINFDTYFPEQSHLETEEKENIMKAIEGGELVISCKY